MLELRLHPPAEGLPGSLQLGEVLGNVRSGVLHCHLQHSSVRAPRDTVEVDRLVLGRQELGPQMTVEEGESVFDHLLDGRSLPRVA